MQIELIHMENNTNIYINTNNCMCRKNKTNGLFLQCNNKRKYGLYCGKHHNNKWKLKINENIDTKTLKLYHNYLKKKETQTYDYITLNDYINNKNLHYTCDKLKKTLDKLKLSKSGKKSNLQNKIKNYYDNLIPYNNNLDKIILIQKSFRNYVTKKNTKLRGIGYIDKKLCNNLEDFFSFEELKDIEDKYFFSFADKDKFVYGFDIRSFKKLVEMKMKNPYNRNPLPKKAIENMKTLYKINNIENEKEDDSLITKKQKLNHRVIKLFQEIDDLGAAAGGTNIAWFMDLNIIEIKKFYKSLEDIWNYRAELTQTQKYNIIKENTIFQVSVSNFYKLKELNKMRKIILKDMETLVYTANNNSEKSLGAYYILIALCEVSVNCATSLPWLVQS